MLIQSKVIMEKTTAEWLMFARWGICVQAVADNSLLFAFQAFERFTSLNHIKHITTSPATNGLAEHFVQTLKHALQRRTNLPASGGEFPDELSKCQACYPCRVTNTSDDWPGYEEPFAFADTRSRGNCRQEQVSTSTSTSNSMGTRVLK